MKNSWRFIGLIVAFQFAFSIGVRADESGTKKAMVAKYQLIQQAYLDANSEEIENQLASNFTSKKSGNRTFNRAQFIAEQHDLFSAISRVRQATLRINKVSVAGNRAVVVVTQVYDFEMEGAQGRTHRLKEKSVCRDTWVENSGQWKSTSSEFVNGFTTHFFQAKDGDDARIKAQMVENYMLWQEAYKLQDAERIISFESPDFTFVSASGVLTSKAKNDTQLRDFTGMIRKVHDARIEIKKLSIEPNRVVVWNKQRFDANVIDHQKQPHRVSFVLSTKDIWFHYDGIWMLKRMEELTSKVVVDGKSVSP